MFPRRINRLQYVFYMLIFGSICSTITFFAVSFQNTQTIYVMDNCTQEAYDDPVTWQNTPSLTLLCRTYGGAAMEFYNIFAVGYLLFWPYKYWTNSDLVVVLDDESMLDHRMGTLLANLPPYPTIKFEKIPEETTFCSKFRREGYSRQMYSSFYADRYTTSEYVGLIDADSILSAKATPEDLFIAGKPRIVGYNGCCTSWTDPVQETIGIRPVAEFMIGTGFPIIIRRSHFKLVREHITRRMQARSFEEAFHRMCTKYATRYSQFDLLVHYLWHFKHNEYSWHINDGPLSKHGAFPKRINERKNLLEYNKPIIAVMKHVGHLAFSSDMFNIIYDYLCLASEMEAGDCGKYQRNDIDFGTVANLFTDWLSQTAYWSERGMPEKDKMVEIPWTYMNRTWEDAYDTHSANVKSRGRDSWTWRRFDESLIS